LFGGERAIVASIARCLSNSMTSPSSSNTSSRNSTAAKRLAGTWRLPVTIATVTRGRTSPALIRSPEKKTWLFHPRRHKWSKHFRWAGPLLEGRTPVGRATITALNINLRNRVLLREELTIEGAFPPDLGGSA
jgi:hypothetical protein